ncbi:sensor histidine kinase [Enterocloster clostridioformis]|uniref:sensor histidine kinase n=1 Tax=Enterocloster clostridioformis TaxID=1531 RepID=UPI00080CBA2D|nr:sensor histidine kinase [Enterocloster clostridioformis]ANU45871.1 sensor histidine kinase [Lachnoclostridium sp. YL32]NDO30268.1 sensor histidine kinase [Enterocloster clostridioformis]OXE67625.1 sensor histidine kinase [Enterocloster clostridioformis]QQQ99375.1 sensor histidine kinase [Enterocloster clostridioformis]
MEGRQGRKLHGIWMSCSLERKVRWITISTAAVVILSITAVMLVAGYGMKGFGDLLMGNSRSLAFWSAMDAESSSFQYYAGDRTPENREKYEMSCARTRSALKSLPFDYEEIGADRYGVTWSILNMYENYAAARDAFLEMEEGAPDYLDRLYTIYRVQGYLATHAGRLEQMTVESGNERYEMQRPLFIIVPAVSILWGAAALLMVRWLNRSVQRNIVRPMVELAEDSRRIGENDFTGPDTHAEGGDEIASLVRAFCTMKASTRGYIEALTEKHKMEKQLDEVRLQMLKNQINPHFLFNTLNMIASTAQIEDAATTEKMIHALSRLFRYNLKSTDSVMPLERELKVVQDYMYLQQMRFGQRIRYDTDCKPDTLEVLVPSFALQPLVENAIIHGISPKGQGGRIHVRSWMEGRRIWISVADTGRGMARERLEEIRRALARGEEKATGVGVGNIYRRVHGMYQDGEIFIYSSEGRGTVVQMAFTP